MTRPELIVLLRKIERMDRAVRIEGTPAVQERWHDLANTLRRNIEAEGIKEGT
jgi:hypothetical protein